VPLRWDSEVGNEVEEPQVALEHFFFPMAGASWDSVFVNRLGTLSFGSGSRAFHIGRVAELRTAGASIPGGCPPTYFLSGA
jgi:hypothetical protein